MNMKKLLFLLLVPVITQAQPIDTIAPGEYNAWAIRGKQVYDLSAGFPQLVAGQPAAVTQVAGCLHHQALIDNQGGVYCWGDNSAGECGNGQVGGTVATPTRVTVDSAGRPMPAMAQVVPYANGSVASATAKWYGTIARTVDGRVCIWGSTGTGNRGNGLQGGLNPLPVWINFPEPIKKVLMANVGIALGVSGKVYTWGGGDGSWQTPYLLSQGIANPDPTVPHAISLPAAAIDIAGGSLFNYALLANGSLAGWAYHADALGLPSALPAPLGPTVLDGFLLPPGKKFSQIAVNNESSYAILNDSSGLAWGDNACGTIGNGEELGFAIYSTPYAWSWTWGQLITPATPILPGVKLVRFYGGVGDVFYIYAKDANGKIWAWGRHKGNVIADGVIEANSTQTDKLPNSWDVIWPKVVDPFALTAVVPTNSPFCTTNPGMHGCPLTPTAPSCPPPAACPVCPPQVVCPVCPAIPPPRKVVSIAITPAGILITFDDGTTQTF